MQEQINKKVYDVADIQNILGIGRSKTYTFLEKVYQEQEPFKVIKIGKLYKIPIYDFNNWLNGNCISSNTDKI